LQIATHMLLQLLLQQNEATLQTHVSQAQPLQPGVLWGWHIAAQVPQSLAQLVQVSPWLGWQTPLPQEQGPQSCWQVVQVSP